MRSVLVSSLMNLSLAVAFALPAQAKFMVETGSVAPEGTPWAEWLDGVKKRIEKDSKNELKLKLFLASRRGGEKEMVEDVKKGRMQLFGGSVGAVASKYAPELNVFELPFIFESDAEADYVLNAVRGDVEKLLAKRGFIFVMWTENGWHGYGTKAKCVMSPADMKGLKMRSQESMIHAETYRSFGASPEEMPVPEVLHSLQTGVVDGFSNTPLFSQAVSWHTGIKYYTYTQHIYQPALIIASKVWFDTLPPNLQTIMKSNKEEKSGLEGVRSLTPLLLENFKASDIKVCNVSPAEKKVFSKASRGVWDKFQAQSKGNKKIFKAVMAAKAAFAKK
ncbi:MAG: TRAP transporter substrate-binding protein [Deltaproteobacteria bacterium]|nr:TRAP transporter substrate-binding protein [Deltaproteobacteria bacterium]